MSDDGSKVATVNGHSVEAWDAYTGKKLASSTVGNHFPHAVSFSQDGSLMLNIQTLAVDNDVWEDFVVITDLKTGERIFSQQMTNDDYTLVGTNRRLLPSISYDNKRVVFHVRPIDHRDNLKGRADVWDISEKARIATYYAGVDTAFEEAIFNPRGQLLLRIEHNPKQLVVDLPVSKEPHNSSAVILKEMTAGSVAGIQCLNLF